MNYQELSLDDDMNTQINSQLNGQLNSQLNSHIKHYPQQIHQNIPHDNVQDHGVNDVGNEEEEEEEEEDVEIEEQEEDDEENGDVGEEVDVGEDDEEEEEEEEDEEEGEGEEEDDDEDDELDMSEPAGAFANVGQGLSGKYKNYMMQYWQNTIDSIEKDEHDFKNHQLPLARIKKVMKTDEEVKMISAEAPILFAKGCDIFITELTMRAWIHAEENKRRTLQKSDIAAALQKSDMFDFLIDIVPRDDDINKKKNV